MAMSYATHIQEVERDLARLYRKATQVEADLRDVAVLPAAKLHSALFALTSKHPGLVSLGVLLGLPASDQQGLVRGLWPAGAQRDFVQRLLDTVQTDTGLMNGFRRLLPQTVPPEPRSPSIARPTPPPSSETPKRFQPAPDQPEPEPEPDPDPDPAKPERDPAELEPEPIDETLRRLIFKCLQSPELLAVHFAAPVSGHLAGRPIAEGDSLNLNTADDGDLTIQGPGHHNFYKFGGNVGPGSVPASMVSNAALMLRDGSRVFAETFSAASVTQSPMADHGTWQGALGEWLWWKAEDVHYWITQVEGIAVRSAKNLMIQSQSGPMDGIHVPGNATVTLIQHPSVANQRLLFVRAAPRPLDSTWTTWALCDISTVLFGLQSPWRLYGFNAQGSLVAITGRHRDLDMPIRSNQLELLRFVPLRRLKSYRGSLFWLPLFAQRLFDECLRPHSVIIESILEYRSIFTMTSLADQLAKLGSVIRILLHSEGTLRADSYLRPEGVSTALRSFARQRSIRLPEGAAASLEATHRIALLGERGLAEGSIDRHSIWRSGRPIEMLNTLRITYASLLAAIIGYSGPIDASDDSQSRKPRLIHPLRVTHFDAYVLDPRLAALRYVAEPPSKT